MFLESKGFIYEAICIIFFVSLFFTVIVLRFKMTNVKHSKHYGRNMYRYYKHLMLLNAHLRIST